ncbi:hypothetical protein V8F06_007620 [Rhypophila decipiens]
MAEQDYYKDDQQRQQYRSSPPLRNSYYPVYPPTQTPGVPHDQNTTGYSPYQNPSPVGSAQGYNLPQNPPPRGQIPYLQSNHADTGNIYSAYYSSPSPPAQGYPALQTWLSPQPLQWYQQQLHLQPCQSSYSTSPSPSHLPPSTLSQHSLGSMNVNPSLGPRPRPGPPAAGSGPNTSYYQSSSHALGPTSPPASGALSLGEHESHSNDNEQTGSPQTDPQSEQDRGLLATLSGGAGDAFIGSKFKVGNGQHNTMTETAGAVAGAVTANVIEDKPKNQKYATGSSFYSQSQRGGQQTHGSTGGNAGGLAGTFDKLGGLLAGKSDGAGNTRLEVNPQSPGQAQAQGQSSYGSGGQDQRSYEYGFQGQRHAQVPPQFGHQYAQQHHQQYNQQLYNQHYHQQYAQQQYAQQQAAALGYNNIHGDAKGSGQYGGQYGYPYSYIGQPQNQPGSQSYNSPPAAVPYDEQSPSSPPYGTSSSQEQRQHQQQQQYGGGFQPGQSPQYGGGAGGYPQQGAGHHGHGHSHSSGGW